MLNRNFGLDIIRTLSIWLVLLDHSGINIPGLEPMRMGSIGVEFFFVLSGFLMGGILFNDIDRNNSIRSTLLKFWKRRWFRILPLYYAVLLFKLIFIDSSIGWNIGYYILFLQNNFYGISFMGVSWSLVIEEWFYLIAPIYLIFSVRILKSNKLIYASLLLFLLFINVIRFIYVYYFHIPYHGVNGNFIFRLDSLFIGVIFAFIKHRNINFFNKLSNFKVFTIGITCIGMYVFYYWTLAYPNKLIDITILPRTLGFFIFPFFISLIIPYIHSFSTIALDGPFKRMFYFFITYTSLFTYAIYLTHLFVFEWVHPFKLIQNFAIIQVLFSIIITYFISGLVYFYFERPILSLRK